MIAIAGSWKIEVESISYRTYNLGVRLRLTRYSLLLRKRRRLCLGQWKALVGVIVGRTRRIDS